MAGVGLGLNARRFEQVLRQHGCELLRTKGGHAIWRAPNGGTIVATGAGRKGQIPLGVAKTAARTLGLSLQELVR